MSEVASGLSAILSLGIPAVGAFFGMLGGRSTEELAKWKLDFFSNRTWGRWICPLWLSGSLIALSLLKGSFEWPFLAIFATFKAASHMGHGWNGPEWYMKVLRRSLSSLAWSAALIVFPIWSGAWTVWISQVIVSLVICNIWGITNPKPAPEEEAVIAFFKVCLSTFLF